MHLVFDCKLHCTTRPLQDVLLELNCLNQKQDAFLGDFKVHESLMAMKSCATEKAVFQSGICFSIQCLFDLAQCLLLDFKSQRDNLQKNQL